jgi:hypothetical protein
MKKGIWYIQDSDVKVSILDSNWKEKGEMRTVLHNGFDKLPLFSTSILSWVETTPLYYYADRIRFSPKGDIWVSFVGAKPLGVIDAVMFDKNGAITGYWKQEKKSHSAWFDRLTHSQKRDLMDEELDIGFSGDRVIIGRLLQGGGNAVGSRHSIIQMYVLGEGKKK